MTFNEIAMWALNFSAKLIQTFGYVGVFFVGFMGSATVFLPIPSYVVVFLMGSVMNPLLLGIIAGLGASTGELVGYVLGIGGRRIASKKKKWGKQLNKVQKMFNKYGGFFAIIIIAATPIPDNVLGIFCGMIGYPVKKYFIASSIGKIMMHIAIAYAGYYGIGFILTLMGGPVLV